MTHHHTARCYQFPTNAAVYLSKPEVELCAMNWRKVYPGYSVRIAQRGVRAFHQGAMVWVVVARRLICVLGKDGTATP